jgi:hypothetical protein
MVLITPVPHQGVAPRELQQATEVAVTSKAGTADTVPAHPIARAIISSVYQQPVGIHNGHLSCSNEKHIIKPALRRRWALSGLLLLNGCLSSIAPLPSAAAAKSFEPSQPTGGGPPVAAAVPLLSESVIPIPSVAAGEAAEPPNLADQDVRLLFASVYKQLIGLHDGYLRCSGASQLTNRTANSFEVVRSCIRASAPRKSECGSPRAHSIIRRMSEESPTYLLLKNYVKRLRCPAISSVDVDGGVTVPGRSPLELLFALSRFDVARTRADIQNHTILYRRPESVYLLRLCNGVTDYTYYISAGEYIACSSWIPDRFTESK